jgi:hypothetical protein
LLPKLLEAMERHGHLQLNNGVRTQLLTMSAATIDRHPARERTSLRRAQATMRKEKPCT